MLERLARWILSRKQKQATNQQPVPAAGQMQSIIRTDQYGHAIEVSLTQDESDVISAIMIGDGKYLAICEKQGRKIAITNGLDYATTIDFFKRYAKNDELLKTMLTDMVIDLNK